MKAEPRDSRIGPIYAKAGEATYCPNGHVLGHFTKDVKTAAMPAGELVPVDGMSIGATACHVCGAPPCAGLGIYYFKATTAH